MTTPAELERAAGNLAGLARDLERFDPWGGTRSKSDASDLRLLLSERAELLATVERMRAALWPFAQVKPTAESGFVNICALNVDVIAARAALTTGEEK